MRFLLGLLFGMIPEVLYFTLFLTISKNIKEKRLKLFGLLCIAYIICLLLQRCVILYYMLLIALIFISMKFLYKKKVQIVDIFLIGVSYLWLAILSFILMKFVNEDMSNYMFVYVIQRILLFIPFIFKNNFNKIYKKYYKLWNRNDKEKRPIKSITLRNVSLILLNGIIFFLNINIIQIINFSK